MIIIVIVVVINKYQLTYFSLKQHFHFYQLQSKDLKEKIIICKKTDVVVIVVASIIIVPLL
jgi:hypothetical protein